MTQNYGFFSDLACGYEELSRTDHFCIQMLADKARIRVMVKENGKRERYQTKWVMNYYTWKVLHMMMSDVELKDRDIIMGPVEYRYLPVARSVLWINGRQFKFEGTLNEFRKAVQIAYRKILKLRDLR
jgi:hypothetical protein